MNTRLFIIIVLITLCATPVNAHVVPEAYDLIARKYGVPPALLFAVCQAESGARLRSGKQLPWPWTLNIAGKSARFLTRREAWHALQSSLIGGVTSVDIGLCQINWRWNGKEFTDTWSALDPFINIAVAARLLRRHYDVRGDWWAAVGAYHSPGDAPEQQQRARNYIESVRDRLSRVSTMSDVVLPVSNDTLSWTI